MKLTKKEEEILKEYLKIQNKFNILKNHMDQIKDDANGLIEELEKIRNKEKALFKKINKNNGKKES